MNKILKKFPPCYNLYLKNDSNIDILTDIISEINNCLSEVEQIQNDNNLILKECGYINVEDIKFDKPTFFLHIRDFSCDIYTGITLYYLFKRLLLDYKLIINCYGDVSLPVMIMILCGTEVYAKEDTEFIMTNIKNSIFNVTHENDKVEIERVTEIVKNILLSKNLNKGFIEQLLLNKDSICLSSNLAKYYGILKGILL